MEAAQPIPGSAFPLKVINKVTRPRTYETHTDPEKLWPSDRNSEVYCFGQAHIPFGVTDRTSGPHPRPDPPTDGW